MARRAGLKKFRAALEIRFEPGGVDEFLIAGEARVWCLRVRRAQCSEQGEDGKGK
jgi:hypothetical protein